MFSKHSKQKLEKVSPRLIGVVLFAVSITAAFPYATFASEISSERLIELTNQARASQGLSVLLVDSELTISAQKKSNDMLEKGYFDHTSPDGLNAWYWFDNVGYRYSYAGENLAADFTSSEDLFAAWMASSTHRANILSPKFRDLGIAVAADDKTILVTQHFGSKTAKIAGEDVASPAGTSASMSGSLLPLFLMTVLTTLLGSSLFGARKFLPEFARFLKTPITFP